MCPGPCQAFRSGLNLFFDDNLRSTLHKCCTVADIRLMLCGTPEIDCEDWRASTVYKGGFRDDSQEVGWFWQVAGRMSAAQRAALLFFCTGSTCVPAMGFAHLMGYGGRQQRFALELVPGPSTRLPSAATCFNTLRLPAYGSEAELEQRLLLAVEGAEGFDEGAVH